MSYYFGAGSLIGLARKVETELEKAEKGGMLLDSLIMISDREHVEGLLIKESSINKADWKGLLVESSNQWFATFHVRSA